MPIAASLSTGTGVLTLTFDRPISVSGWSAGHMTTSGAVGQWQDLIAPSSVVGATLSQKLTSGALDFGTNLLHYNGSWIKGPGGLPVPTFNSFPLATTA